MIEAHISGPRGSLYYSAPTTPYDLENLRTHVREADSVSPRQVHVELRLDRNDRALAPNLTSLIREFTARGIAVHVGRLRAAHR
ncbi:MAG: hypothetical protein E6J72_10640 [Deltaproteobacteria bacterium]|jgi:hypothetical protein|nr:MAG: hypothetical protein E6J72_10640 [Deltaproteobacteria bacterium]